MRNKKFNIRAFVSLYMGISFLIITFSGIILFIAPPGRIANWSYWAILGLTKSEWQAIHTIFTFIFIGVVILHLIFNWKPMLYYLRKKTERFNKIRTELIVTLGVSFFLFISVYYSVPPFSYVLNFGEDITNSWANKQNEPPIPHAERLTITEFTSQLNISIERFENIMNRNSYTIKDINMSIEEVAKANNIMPNDIYNLVKKKSFDACEKTKFGSGLGRKMISEIFQSNNYSWHEGSTILKNNGILLETDRRLKDIAVANNITPSEIIKMLQVN